MFVYIAHAEADQAAADDLKAFMKTRGLVAETETGARGFRQLQASDVVVALWSQKAVFSTYRMTMERRMLDAWADGRLVLVKLDHGFLPVGLRDLPVIDASFETGRQLSVWPQVERAAREAINRALVEREEQRKGVGPGGTTGAASADDEPSVSRAEPASAPAAPQPPAKQAREQAAVEEHEYPAYAEVRTAKRGGGFVGLLLFVAAMAAIGGSAWLVLSPENEFTISLPLNTLGIDGPSDLRLTNLQAAAIAIVIGILLVLMVLSAGRSRPKRKPQKRAEAAPAAAAVASTPAQPRSASATLFISYAHADNAAVTPVVEVVKENGREVWIDKTGLQTGDSWAGEIVRAIKSAGGIMVMCSQRAFESDHVKRELYLADRYKKPLAPVFLEAAQPPEDLEYFFAGVQWLELYKLPEGERKAAIGRALAAV